jgi:hypothetical protein
MDDKKIANLLNATYEKLLKQNKNIKRCEKKLKDLEKILSGNCKNFFDLNALNETMILALVEANKKYFFKYSDDFIHVHSLSDKTKEYTLEKMKEDCSDVTESTDENLKYIERSKEAMKLEKEMKKKFSDEKKAIFEIYLDLLAEIQGAKIVLFYEGMLQTGAYLKNEKLPEQGWADISDVEF